MALVEPKSQGRQRRLRCGGAPRHVLYYLFADPEYDCGEGYKIGGHAELRLRDGDTFRSFVDDNVWFWEAYGYVKTEQWGTLKAGQLFNRFGLFWDGVFFGNAAYFDGFKLDADYGLSWEKSTEVNPCFKLDSFVQYFFHEDQSNGTFSGAEPESIVGYTERNTAVARLVPTWMLDDGAVVELGASARLGEIDSRLPGLPDQTAGGYGLDVTYTRGRWKGFIEGSQQFGTRSPARYVSGGPSNRLTNLLAGLQYTRGAVTYRCSYSNSFGANPDGRQHLVVVGATVSITKNVDLYLEYVYLRIDGNALPAANGDLFNSLAYVINWHF